MGSERLRYIKYDIDKTIPDEEKPKPFLYLGIEDESDTEDVNGDFIIEYGSDADRSSYNESDYDSDNSSNN